MRIPHLGYVVFFLGGVSAQAADPSLALPLSCRLGQTCWIMNYADDDPGPAAQDYMCRPRSYQGHDGTDFAVRDLAAMRQGVPVLATAAGTVVQTRDGQQDGLWYDGHQDQVKATNSFCGNRVAVKVADQWVTDYCHLKNGSVRVKPGDTVAAGQILGLVGMSGATEFPHVHLGVRFYPPGNPMGQAVDPFTGVAIVQGCGKMGKPLWTSPPAYQPVSLYAVGFADHMPQAAQVRDDASSPPNLSSASGTLVLWAAMMGVATGDRLTMTITGPDGQVVGSAGVAVDKNLAWQHMALSRPRPGVAWPPGVYGGVARIDRAGLAPVERAVQVDVR